MAWFDYWTPRMVFFGTVPMTKNDRFNDRVRYIINGVWSQYRNTIFQYLLI